MPDLPTNIVTESDLEIARMVVERDFGGPVEVTAIVGDGSVNKIVRADVGGERLIVRMCDRGSGARNYPKEAWCLEQAGAAEIPSPKVLGIGEVDETAYMVMTFVDGVGGKAFEGDKLTLWRTIGRYARIVHNIPVHGFGNELRDGSRHLFGNNHTQNWPEFVQYNIDSLTADDPALAMGVYTADDRSWLVDTFTTLFHLGDRIGLNHGDLALRNLIVGADGQVTLIDWGCCSANVVPHSDFASLLTWYSPKSDVLAAFFDGYGLTSGEVDSLMPILQQFQVIQTFDTFRWSLEHCVAEVDRYAERAASVLREARGAIA